MTQINIKKLDNGLTIIIETMAEVASGAFSIRLPAGTARQENGQSGLASIMTELVFRGTEKNDSRSLNQKLDSLGLHRHESTGNISSSFGGALLADKLPEVFEIYAEIFTQATLDFSQFEFCRMLALQNLDSLEDDPRHKISLMAYENFMLAPYGRPYLGHKEQLEDLTVGQAQIFYQNFYNPQETIISLAGNIQPEQGFDMVEKYFGAWQGKALEKLGPAQCQIKNCHQQKAGAQVHIAVIYPSVNIYSPDYYKAKAAMAILSGGMGSRLFTEVREKRGLCYAVGASHTMIAEQGLVMGYVGSSPDKAQLALEVMQEEFVKLADGISEDELQRAKIGLRSSIIMQGESSSARANGCTGDYALLGRVRTLEEISEAIEALTIEDVVGFAENNKPGNFSVTTIGPKKLDLK